MAAIGVDTSAPEFKHTKFFTAHEALLLNYEEALTRIPLVDSTVTAPASDGGDDGHYDCSAHMVCLSFVGIVFGGVVV